MIHLSMRNSEWGMKGLIMAAAAVVAGLFSAGLSAASEDVQARAAVVMEASSGRVLYAKNPELRLMPASTTKLMTALVAVEKLNLKDVVKISRNASGVAPTKSGFKEGDKVTVETLLYAALMKSANDAAVALAEAAAGTEEQFVQLMNRKALALGAADTKFINPNGLPGKGQYTTAYDLSKIMRQAIKHPVLKEILGTRSTELSTETGKTVHIRNTNKLLWQDEELLGGKTGFTNAARHCFVCAGERDSNTLIVAVLGAPSRAELWKGTENLMDFGSRVIRNQEEPVVYLTRSDYDGTAVSKAAYTRKSGSGRRGKRGGSVAAAAQGPAPKGKAIKAAHKTKAGSSAALKAKSRTKKGGKMMVKAKKAKKTNVAAKKHDGTNG